MIVLSIYFCHSISFHPIPPSLEWLATVAVFTRWLKRGLFLLYVKSWSMSHPSTQHLWFNITGHYFCAIPTSVFAANLTLPLDDRCCKAMQFVIMEYTCMPFICGKETLTGLNKNHLILRSKFRQKILLS